MSRRVLSIAIVAGCGSTPPVASTPDPTPTPPPSADAAPATPDAPALPQAVLDAPAWVFGYHTADRSETWTLQHAGGNALLVVEAAAGTQRYIGTAEDTSALAVDVRSGTARMTLECKHEQLAVGARCNDPKAKKVEVLACYHPDFKAPMPFGKAPGIEYVVDGGCTGYRAIAAP